MQTDSFLLYDFDQLTLLVLVVKGKSLLDSILFLNESTICPFEQIMWNCEKMTGRILCVDRHDMLLRGFVAVTGVTLSDELRRDKR